MVDLSGVIDNFTQATVEIFAISAQVIAGIFAYLRDNYLTTLAAILVVGLLIVSMNKSKGGQASSKSLTNVFK